MLMEVVLFQCRWRQSWASRRCSWTSGARSTSLASWSTPRDLPALYNGNMKIRYINLFNHPLGNFFFSWRFSPFCLWGHTSKDTNVLGQGFHRERKIKSFFFCLSFFCQKLFFPWLSESKSGNFSTFLHLSWARETFRSLLWFVLLSAFFFPQKPFLSWYACKQRFQTLESPPFPIKYRVRRWLHVLLQIWY